ncbi:MAG: hypothetical protein KBT78_01015 [Marinobacter psychrophilus]|nr:hypothetical protein [Marinobacter psychrophilus]MBQ0843403.1 hypothetical protein [Marinobacter psychrophilus]
MDSELYEGIDEKIFWALIQSIPLLLIAALIPFLATVEALRPEAEDTALWFQRSGSLTVLFAVLSEFRLQTVDEHINPRGIWDSFQENMKQKYSRKHFLLSAISVLLAIIGTIIWGYGDLFIAIP